MIFSLSHIFLITIILCINTAHAQKTMVEEHIGTDKIQGLKYINNASHDFIATYNQKNKTRWQSLQPDARIQVEKCVTPFKTSWSYPKNLIPAEKNYWNIQVTCDQTTAGSFKKHWDISIPTTRPINKAIQ